MGKIIEKKDFADETVRELGFEVIMTLVEKKSTLLSKDSEKLKLFIEIIYKFALEMEDDITDDWVNPKTESYINEVLISEEKLQTAISFVDRLTEILTSKVVLPYL